MANQIVLNRPPFTPAEDQVIYLEWQQNERVNAFIRKHYEWLKELFLSYGLNFCYLPLLGKEVIKYNAPHLTDEECDKILASLPSVQDYVVKNDEINGPILAFSTGKVDNSAPDLISLYCIEIENKWFKPTKSIFKQLAEEIHSTRECNKRNEIPKYFDKEALDVGVAEETSVNYKTIDESSDIRFSTSSIEKEADETFNEQAKVLVEEIKERINALRGFGVNTMFLHNIIDEGEHISSLYITKDYRIILPDYDNLEIIIPDLPKAVFLLFLRHPEGIRFKDLADYREELITIYLALNPIGGTQRQQRSIRDLTNPLSNSINEKCAKIREAFVSKFDDRLAKNYYITGERGEPKRISLSPSLIVWEQ